MNDTIPLDGGGWRFAPDPFREGETLGWHQPDHAGTRHWPEVTVPIAFDRCLPSLPGYEGPGWFRREVRLPAEWQGRPVSLTCGAVGGQVRCWINGVLIGTSEDALQPREIPIPADTLKYGGPVPNVLVIESDNTPFRGDVSGERIPGGLLRPLSLVARRGPISLDSVTVQTFPPPLGAADLFWSIAIQGTIRDSRDAEQHTPLHFTVAIEDPQGNVVATLDSEGPYEPDVPEGAPGPERYASLPARGVVSPVTPWSPETPALYRARVRLRNGDATLDTQDITFGFRHIAVQNSWLTLNGMPILLLGYNRHEDSPRTDAATDPELTRHDLLRIKQTGANFVRLRHYDPATLHLCDEIGLLVMAELPVYGGLERGGDTAEGRFIDLVTRDFHHPSVAFWSVGSELVEFLRDFDPSRLAVHISNHWADEPHFEADDVICVNGYPFLHGRGGNKGEPLPDPAASGTWWRDSLRTLHERYPDKPILVTEFGHGAIEGAPEGTASEATQAEVLQEQLRNILRAGPWVCGATVQCWADHPASEGEGRPYYLRTSPFGVVTRNRRAKRALESLEKSFRGTASRPSLFLRRPDLENLPPLDLPEGYILRIARDDDAELLAEMLGRAFAEKSWTAENVRDWLLNDETVKTTFMIEQNGKPVATASARLLPEQHPGSGYVHWVGAEPEQRGKRLGYLASLATLHEFVRLGCRDAVLDTDDFRIPAIKVYLNLGFVPEHRHATHPVRWAKIAPKLEGYLPQ